MTVQLLELLEAAEEIARDAGAVVLAGAQNPGRGARSKASALDIATDTDVAAERLIVERIAAAFPDDGLLGEEGSSRAGATGRRWIIDPLDGTYNFVRDWAASVVSIGVEVDGDYAVGAIFDPFRGELFSAATGMGARLNGRLLPRRTEDIPLDEALVGVAGGYPLRARAERQAIIPRLIARVGDIRCSGSAARDFCYLAAGRLDACFGNGYSVWDLAAGAVIAREVGCIVTGPLEGSEPTGDGVVAAVPTLIPSFRALVSEALAAVST